MNKIILKKMTRELCHEYFREFQLDLDLFADKSKFRPYVYDRAACDTYFDRHADLGRVHLAIIRDKEAIGELILKNIDEIKRCCAMGISMKNDSFKNKGYGTRAEILALEYAFSEMKMETVYADALLGNARSQHVMEKVGFVKTHQDETFVYYRCDKDIWSRQNRKSSSVSL